MVKSMSKTNADRKYCNTYFFKEIDKIFKSNGNAKWTSSDARALLGVNVHISSISNWISGKFLPTDDVIMKFADCIGKDVDYVRGKMIQDYIRIHGELPMRNCFRVAKDVVECANNAYAEDGSTDRVMIDDSDLYRKLHCGPRSPGKIEAVIVEGEKTETKEGMSLQEFYEQQTGVKFEARDVEKVSGDNDTEDLISKYSIPIEDTDDRVPVNITSNYSKYSKAIVTKRRNKALRILDNISKSAFDNDKLKDMCSTTEEIIIYLGNRIVEQGIKIRGLEENYGTTAYYNGVVYGTQVCTNNNGDLIHGDVYDRYISELCENIEITDLTNLLYGKLSYKDFMVFDDLYSHADGRNDDFLVNLINTVIVNVASEIRETDKED